jgi:hypothetical protein
VLLVCPRYCTVYHASLSSRKIHHPRCDACERIFVDASSRGNVRTYQCHCIATDVLDHCIDICYSTCMQSTSLGGRYVGNLSDRKLIWTGAHAEPASSEMPVVAPIIHLHHSHGLRLVCMFNDIFLPECLLRNRLQLVMIHVISNALDVVLWFWAPQPKKPLYRHVCMQVLFPFQKLTCPPFCFEKSTSDEIIRRVKSAPYPFDPNVR